LMGELNTIGGRSVFFLGGKIENLHRVAARVERDFPGVRVAGCYSPPFCKTFARHEIDAMVNAVNSARPDVVWVSLTAPKQEKLIAAHHARFDTAVLGAVGAALDFYSGAVKLPPEWMRRTGLGWLHRFSQEPRRLWRRNMVSAPHFVISVSAAAVKQHLSCILNGGGMHGKS
jgi:N-acetylglucosaminyldiphosphoundecaprenol N-acetyl-beta-D-mannosaminyltransferase